MNLPNIITNPQFQPAPGVIADPRAGAATALLAYIHGDPALSIPAHGCDGSPFFTEVVKAFQTIWNANTNIGVLVPDGNYDQATQAAVRDTVVRFHLPFQPGDELCTALQPLPLPGLQPPATAPLPVIPPGTQVTQPPAQSFFQKNKTTILVVGGIGLLGLLGYAMYAANKGGGGARENPVRRGGGSKRRCPRGMKIQTVIFDRDQFTRGKAAGWLFVHKMSIVKVHETRDSLRYRQHPPEHFTAGSFRTITLGRGIKAVVGCPKR